MAKNKVSEWSSTPANNTDVGGIDIAEGCAPSGINNAIREMMAQIKDMEAGTDGDSFTVGGNLAVTGTSAFTGAITASGGVAGTLTGNVTGNVTGTLTGTIASSTVATTQSASDSSTKVATTAFVRAIIPTGIIMLWSGSSASIPSGWLLCDGSSSTPDLRNRFVVGATSTYAVGATGGSADAVVVSHTHTASVTDSGHVHSIPSSLSGSGVQAASQNNGTSGTSYNSASATTGISVGISTTGVSGTNANLPPYYALCYIMKS